MVIYTKEPQWNSLGKYSDFYIRRFAPRQVVSGSVTLCYFLGLRGSSQQVATFPLKLHPES